MSEHLLIKVFRQLDDSSRVKVQINLFHDGKWIDAMPNEHSMFCKSERFQSILYDHGGQQKMMLIFEDASVFSLNLQTMEVQELQSMLRGRFNPGVTTMNGRIYVAGGIINTTDGDFATQETEEYNSETNVWTALPELIEGRSRFNLLSVKNMLFAVGDIPWHDNSIEYFDQNDNCWKFTVPMFKDYEDFTATVYKDQILTISIKKTEPNEPNILECLDVIQKKWSKFPSFPYCVERVSTFFYQSQLFAAGYKENKGILLKYDDTLSEWTETTEFGTEFDSFQNQYFCVANSFIGQ